MRDEAEPRSQGHQVQVMAAVAQARERLRIALTRPDALLHELAAVVTDLVEAPVVVALLEPAWEGGNRLVRRAIAGSPGVAVGTPVFTDGTVCGEALLAGRPVRVPDMADAPESVHAAACCPGARSLLSVPLLDGPLVVGVVSALSERPDWFDRMDERTVALVVQIAGPQLAALPPYPYGAERPGPSGAGRRTTTSRRPSGTPSTAWRC